MDIDVNKCHVLCNTHSLESRHVLTEDLTANKLGNDVIDLHNMQNDRDGVSGSQQPNDKNGFEKKDEDIEMSFSTCDTFPCSNKIKSSIIECVEVAFDADDITGKNSTAHENIELLPTALGPVSAMKGSREKRGVVPPQKLTVKWDPDVYDPIPNSVSHAVTNNKKPQKQSKKNSKSKQKNGSKSSQKSKHKDKLAGKRGGGG